MGTGRGRGLVERYYELLAARDRAGLIEVLSPDIVVVYNGQVEQFPWSGRFEGIAGFDRFLAALVEHLEVVESEQLAVISDADKVVVQSRGIWRVKANGAVVHGGMVNIFTIADDRISRYDVYADTAAFAAAMSKPTGARSLEADDLLVLGQPEQPHEGE